MDDEKIVLMLKVFKETYKRHADIDKQKNGALFPSLHFLNNTHKIISEAIRNWCDENKEFFDVQIGENELKLYANEALKIMECVIYKMKTVH